MSLLMLVSNDIYALINYLSFVQWLSVGASVLGMVYLRFKKPEMERPIKVIVLVCLCLSVCLLVCLSASVCLCGSSVLKD